MTIRRAAILLTGGDPCLAAKLDRGLAQSPELWCVQGLHRAGVRAGRLVVRQDRSEVNVLGFQEIENDPVIVLVLAREMKVQVARLIAERSHVHDAFEYHSDRADL